MGKIIKVYIPKEAVNNALKEIYIPSTLKKATKSTSTRTSKSKSSNKKSK